MTDYTFDIFVSYRRTTTIGPWVKNHLIPRLEERLDEVAFKPLRIFFDDRLESGTRWPEDLRQTLQKSGVLLAIWSTNYFRSSWCMAEWSSFLKREQHLNLATLHQPRGLVFPIQYSDKEYFPPAAKETQCRYDFSDLNYPDEEFRNTKWYIEFDKLIQKMSKELVRFVQDVPPWKADFPLIEAPPLPPAVMGRPVI